MKTSSIKKNTILKQIIVICVTFAIICLGLYLYVPRHIEFNIEIKERDSERTAILYVNLKKRHYIAKPNTIEGTITIGNELFNVLPEYGSTNLRDLRVVRNNIITGFNIENKNYYGRVNLVYDINDLAIRIWNINDKHRDELLEYWNGKISDIDYTELTKFKE